MEQQADQPDLNTINSSFKSSELHICQNRQSADDMLQESRTSVDPTEYGDDEEEEEEEGEKVDEEGEEEEHEEEDEEEEEEEDGSKFHLNEMRYPDARMGICSVCRFSVKGNVPCNSVELEKSLLCSDGHLLCHRCVQRFAIQSKTNCVLCAARESKESLSSRASSAKSSKQKSKGSKPNRKSSSATYRSRLDEGDCYPDSAATSRSNATLPYTANYYEESCNNWPDTEQDDPNVDDDELKVKNVRTESDVYSYYRAANNEVQINSQMMSECSRRPIQCPRLDCAVNVAFSALTNHFIFDHPEVPILSVDPGEKITLVVNLNGLDYDSSRCLALLLVSGKLSGPAARQFSGSNVHPQYRNRLPLPILAARLHCGTSCTKTVRSTSGEGDCKDGGDVLITWIAGLDIGNTTTGALRCSIQVLDSIVDEAFRSLTYTGPINSLRTAQKPREVFLLGDCIILFDGFINHITSGCENLNVNVTIY